MPNELPGQRDGQTVTQRNLLWDPRSALYGNGNLTIDATNAFDGKNTLKTDYLRPGTPMARITATKLWVPTKRTTVLSGGGSVTTCVLTDSRAFKVGDVIDINGDAITIVTIDYTTDTITWTGSATIVDGEAVTCVTSLAGSEITRGFLNEDIRLLDSQPFGVSWFNRTFSKLLIGGILNDTIVLGDLAAIRAAEAAATTKRLKAVLWADEQGLY